MGLKKDIQLSNGEMCAFHAIYHFSFGADGGCLAEIGAYADEHSALIKRKPIESYTIRCDGVTPTDDVITQIYCIVANDPRYKDAEAFSDEAAYGLAHPKEPLPEKPLAPSPYHQWNPESLQWELPLEGLKALQQAALERINLSRDAAERKGFEAYGYMFDADDKSIQRVSIAAQAASIAKQLGNSISMQWTCADNSVVLLNEDQLLSLPLIMAQSGDALHQKARQLKARIMEAKTLEEINSITW